MKKIILSFFIILSIASCSSLGIKKGMADSDGDGIADKDDVCPNDFDPNGCADGREGSAIPEYAIYFQKLKPTKSIKLNKYFKTGSTLKECNTKITNILEVGLHISDGNYKYFSINENSYAIITTKECIHEDGTLINKQNCTLNNRCNMFNPFCVEKGYARFHLILVTTKVLGHTPLDFDEEEFKTVYENDALDSNWNTIIGIKNLLNSSKIFNDEYSIVIKLFETKKVGTMGEVELLIDPTYNFDKQIDNFFKPTLQ